MHSTYKRKEVGGMKKKKKIILGMGACVVAIAVALVVILTKDDNPTLDNTLENKSTFAKAKENFVGDVQALKDGKYENLQCKDFTANIEGIEGLYNLDIEKNKGYEQRTHLENFEIMDSAINKFFKEDFDKSFIEVDFYIPSEESISIKYTDIKTECVKDECKDATMGYVFGRNTSEGGYMVQTSASLCNSWFSRYGLKDIGPFDGDSSRITSNIFYVSCGRQEEDVELNLQDGKIMLSEMEEKVLKYTNEEFPLPVSEGIRYGISQAFVIDNEEYDGISFKMTRIYKGVPFEYGSSGASGEYIDRFEHDSANIVYASSECVDTLVGFGFPDGNVVENGEITEVISLGEALDLLSEQIGSNSVYDVYGVELVYRSCEVPEDRKDEILEILKPVWKVITVNQNDDKYTLFYIDVVTGEITERFEYYNE